MFQIAYILKMFNHF